MNIPTIISHAGTGCQLTYLHLAVGNGQIDMVEKIMTNSVEFGIDLNAKDYILYLHCEKIGHGLEHVKTNLRFFGLSLNFYSNF